MAPKLLWQLCTYNLLTAAPTPGQEQRPKHLLVLFLFFSWLLLLFLSLSLLFLSLSPPEVAATTPLGGGTQLSQLLAGISSWTFKERQRGVSC